MTHKLLSMKSPKPAKRTLLTSEMLLQELKAFFRDVHGEDEITFPEQYPVSALVGCVTVVDVLTVWSYILPAFLCRWGCTPQ